MQFLKILLNSYLGQLVLSSLAFCYIKCVFYTTRWQRINTDILENYLDKKNPAIFAFWHGRLLMVANFASDKSRIHAMISRHGDGELIARTIKLLGVNLIRGSTNRHKEGKKKKKNRGGTAALREALSLLNHGYVVGITPDGPRGPRMHVSGSIIDIAHRADVPIIPVTFSTSRGNILNSWDRFLLATPFNKGVFICGNPITIAKDADTHAREKARKAVENQLNTITEQADMLVGRVPVKPA